MMKNLNNTKTLYEAGAVSRNDYESLEKHKDWFEEIKNQEVYLNEEVTQVIQAMNELTNKLLEY